MSNYKWLLDAGHGGMTADGKYLTLPGQERENMYVFRDGLTFYEGVNNRAIVDELIQSLEYARIDYEMIHDEFLDTTLEERVATANKYYAEDQRCVYVSVHSDTMPKGRHGKRSGYGIYAWKGKNRTRIELTRSEKIADSFSFSYGLVPEFKFKVRKDYIHEDTREDFYVLRETKCPAVLTQNLFYDNRKEAEYLLSEDGQEAIACALLYGIMYSEEVVPI